MSTVSHPKLLAWLEPLGDHVADDHDRRAQQLRRVRRREPDRAGAGDVDGGAGRDARRVRAVIAGREDVRQHRQVEDLLHRLFLVGERQQIPIGVRHEHVLRLAADPSAHIDVSVGRAGTVRVDVQADAGVPGLAHAAPPARDVERHRAQIALLDELDARPGLDHLTGDLVPEDQSLGRGRAAADHVLVGAADVGRYALEDRRMRELAADVPRVHSGPVLQLEGREVDVVDLDLAGPHVGHASVVCHLSRSFQLLPAGSNAGAGARCTTTPLPPKTAISLVGRALRPVHLVRSENRRRQLWSSRPRLPAA